MTASLYTNFPAELRVLKQWVLWRFVPQDDKKPAKVPYHPNGYKADPVEPSTWSSFDECFNALQHGNYSGLGFVFSKTDPYTFIDLDDAHGDEIILERHIKIFNEFETYAEISPSGKGLHLICKGTVSAGRRRSNIEVYPHERYATMTGNVYNNRNVITDCQSQLTQLFEQMGNGPVIQSMYNGTKEETNTDQEIIERATNAINGDKFVTLFRGDWRKVFPHTPLDQGPSEADFALIDIIAYYTQNVAQIERIFKSSNLGKRDKIKRKDYLPNMINRSFDRMMPPLDFDGLRNAIDTKLNGSVAQLVEPTAHNSISAGSIPATPTTPPGLLGDIASFIYTAAPRPVPEVALAAAISLMAGICGRAYNISGTGLNQYVLLLAMTGAGKEAAASGINKLMGKIKMQVPTSTGFIGPSEISSGAALFKYLGNTSQSFVSLLGEFGLRLQQMSSPNANGAEVSLRRMFLDLYNKSGQSEILHASVYSDKANNTSAVLSPSFSILGESTPERFYGALNEDMISEGLLPRFLLIEYKGNRPALNERHTEVSPSFELIQQLAALAAQCDSLNHSASRKPVDVQSTSEAAKMLYDFDKYADNKINGSNKEVIRQLWNRAHIKVLKLSALIAVGENYVNPIINANAMRWAADLVMSDIAALTERFEAGDIGANTFEVKQANEIIRVIKDYVKNTYDDARVEKYAPKSQTIHDNKVIPYVYIQRRLVASAAFRNDRGGPTIAIKRAIQNLVDADRIKEMDKRIVLDKYKTIQRCFVVADLSILD